MQPLSLFCKSYLPDLQRARSLVESVRKFNRDRIRLYLSVPQKDLAAFKNNMGVEGVEWVTDEDIASTVGPKNLTRLTQTPGHLAQQVVKSEFWRLRLSESYFCLDSDCLFIRPFGASDFLAPDATPYTVLHEGKPLRQFCRAHALTHEIQNFDAEKNAALKIFGRTGVIYNFGPLPVVWSANVWASLDENFLQPRGMCLFDAIQLHPSEATWYGEALMKYRAIQLYPREPFFRAYLYLEEYIQDRAAGIGTETLAADYMGIVYQSNWYPKRLRPVKRLAYTIKKVMRRFGLR
jgi:hypothetical protein